MLQSLTKVMAEPDICLYWDKLSLASLGKLPESGCAEMPYCVAQGRFSLETQPGETDVVFSGNSTEARGGLLPAPERPASMQSHRAQLSSELWLAVGRCSQK